MPFVIKTNKGYIKRTSHFGTSHGSIVMTSDINEAFRFTRKSDAVNRASTARFRTKEADDFGKWYSGRGRDFDKFGGTLTTEVEEI